MGISLGKFYSILKKNPEIEQDVLDARKIGIQTSIDRLLEIFNHQELFLNQILLDYIPDSIGLELFLKNNETAPSTA